MSKPPSTKSEALTENRAKGPLAVSPCPCVSVKHTNYFSCFSIVLLIKYSTAIIVSATGVFTQPTLYSIILMSISILLLSWVLLIFIDYARRKEYGTNWAFFYAIANMVNYITITFFFLCFSISVALADLNEFEELKGVNRTALILSLFLFFLPFLGYGLYLSILFFIVIDTERETVKRLELHNRSGDSPQSSPTSPKLAGYETT